MGGYGRAGYPYLLATELGYRYKLFAVGGSGFVQGAPTDDFASRVDAVIGLAPDVVLVEGGHNDVTYPPRQVRAAADDVLTRLERGLPDATVVVQGVPWAGEYTPPVRAVNRQIRAVARQHDVPFVDASGWFARRGIGRDGIHPTDAGHRLMASRMAAALGKLDLRSEGDLQSR